MDEDQENSDPNFPIFSETYAHQLGNPRALVAKKKVLEELTGYFFARALTENEPNKTADSGEIAIKKYGL